MLAVVVGNWQRVIRSGNDGDLTGFALPPEPIPLDVQRSPSALIPAFIVTRARAPVQLGVTYITFAPGSRSRMNSSFATEARPATGSRSSVIRRMI
jgi:hypothetical protein